MQASYYRRILGTLAELQAQPCMRPENPAFTESLLAVSCEVVLKSNKPVSFAFFCSSKAFKIDIIPVDESICAVFFFPMRFLHSFPGVLHYCTRALQRRDIKSWNSPIRLSNLRRFHLG